MRQTSNPYATFLILFILFALRTAWEMYSGKASMKGTTVEENKNPVEYYFIVIFNMVLAAGCLLG